MRKEKKPKTEIVLLTQQMEKLIKDFKKRKKIEKKIKKKM